MSHSYLLLNSRLGDRTLTVSYAEPKQSEMNQDQVKSVYVGGLTAAATKETLQAFFEGLDNVGEVNGFTFVTLVSVAFALFLACRYPTTL